MEQSITLQVKQKNKSKQVIPLLICPYCMMKFPSIKFPYIIHGINDEIHFNCSCLEKEITIKIDLFLKSLFNYKTQVHKCFDHTSNAEKYCTICLKWLCKVCLKDHNHFLLDYEINVQCTLHKKPYSIYCKQCELDCCSECLEKHSNHPFVYLHIDKKKLDINAVKQFKEANRSLVNSLIEELKQANDTDGIKDLKSKLKYNEFINKHLYMLYKSYCKTALIFHKYPTYNLMKKPKLVLKTVNNIEEEDIEEDKIVIDKESITKHLKKNLILQIKKFDESIATLQGTYLCFIQLRDGRLATASTEENIHILEMTSFKCSHTFKTSHKKPIWSLYQLTNGRLVSCSEDCTIKIWNLNTFKCVKTLTDHTDPVTIVIQLNDGRLVSSAKSGSIKIWSKKSKKCVSTLNGHRKVVYSVIQLFDDTLASGSEDCTVKFWNMNNYECIKALKTSLPVYNLIQLTDRRLAVTTSGYHGYIQIWNIETSQLITKLIHFYKMLYSLELIDGRLAGASHQITIWNSTLTKKPSISIEGPSDCLSLIQLTDGRVLSLSTDLVIRIWPTYVIK